MWRNYVIVGLRSLAKNKTYAFINIFGLSLGIAACLLILNFVRYEFSYNAWMKDADRSFQLQDFYKATETGGEEMKLQVTSIAAGRALKKDFPQFEHVVYVTTPPVTVIQDGQATRPENALLVDGPIFDVLQVPFVRGDPAHVLDDPHAVVLSETEAAKRFGTANPVGQTLTLNSGDLETDYRVTGVFKDLPKNTTVPMDLVARFDPDTYFARSPGTVTGWGNQNGFIYAKLRPGVDPKAIEAQFPAWEKRNIPDDITDGKRTNQGDVQDWHLTPLRDIHLGEAQVGAQRSTGDKATMISFVVIALLILGIACVNFTNLATARASQRAREVALRKVLGATRRQLVTQFVGESVLVAAIAMLIALALVELATPALNGFLDIDMSVRYFGAGGMLLPILGLIVVVGLAGGLYPAFYLSRFQPARVLKANKSAADAEGSGRLRSILVIGQFAVSIGLIVCTSVIYAQTMYARSVDQGYTREGLLQVRRLSTPKIERIQKTLVQEVRGIPGVTAVGRSTIGVATGNNSMTSAKRPGAANESDIGFYGMDPGVIDALGMKLIAGRNFSEANPMDDATTPSPPDDAAERALVARGVNVLLSESAAKRLGFASAQAAIGQPLQTGLTDTAKYGWLPATVVGVVSDVRYRTVREPLQPILYYYQTVGYNNLLIRYQGVAPDVIRARVEAVWKRLAPDVPFEARHAEDIVHDLYNGDEQRAQLFGMFAILAVVIGCLGLFGLAAFTAERRTKEIGIRKVLGARTQDIVRLLVWQFSRPVLVANLIAWPIAWWAMRDWLNGFESRISLSPLPFLLAGGLALAIAIATIAAHAWRVAQTNPVHALRYE